MADPIYTAGETAQLAVLLARGSRQAQLGNPTTEVDRKREAIRETARKRGELVEAARRKLADQKLIEQAEKRAARKFW